MNRKIIFLLVIAILLANFVYAVRYITNKEELIFNFNIQKYQSGIISITTDTDPLLVSITKSNNLNDFLDISPINNLRVTKKEPLVLELNAKTPQDELNGFITLNFLYEKLPKNINYYGDDTIKIPVKITRYDTESSTKIEIKLTEELLSNGKATSLDAGLILPIVVVLILLIFFRKKWKK